MLCIYTYSDENKLKEMVDHLQEKIEAVAKKHNTDKKALRKTIRDLVFYFEDVTNQVANNLHALVKYINFCNVSLIICRLIYWYYW